MNAIDRKSFCLTYMGYRGVLNFPTLNFPTVLIFPTIFDMLIFSAPMLNFPTIFEFGQKIQKKYAIWLKFCLLSVNLLRKLLVSLEISRQLSTSSWKNRKKSQIFISSDVIFGDSCLCTKFSNGILKSYFWAYVLNFPTSAKFSHDLLNFPTIF